MRAQHYVWRIASICLCFCWSFGESHKPLQTDTFYAAQTVCNGQENWSYAADPANCNKFYLCYNNTAEQLSCPENYYFDAHAELCVKGDTSCLSVFCKNEINQYVAVGIDNDCRKFGICFNSELHIYDCPPETFFVPTFGICIGVDANYASYTCACVASEYTVLPIEDSCTDFHVCLHGIAVRQQCPSGLYFDVQLNACLPDWNMKCLNDLEADLQDVCLHHEDIISFHAHPSACDKFVICDNSRAFVHQCPSEFYFNNELGLCAEDEQGICYNKSQQHLTQLYQIETSLEKTHHKKPVPVNNREQNSVEKFKETEHTNIVPQPDLPQQLLEHKKKYKKNNKKLESHAAMPLLVETTQEKQEKPQSKNPKKNHNKVAAALLENDIIQETGEIETTAVPNKQVNEKTKQSKKTQEIDYKPAASSPEEVIIDEDANVEKLNYLQNESQQSFTLLELEKVPEQAAVSQEKQPFNSLYDKLVSKFITF